MYMCNTAVNDNQDRNIPSCHIHREKWNHSDSIRDTSCKIYISERMAEKANKRVKAQFPFPWNKSEFLAFTMKHRDKFVFGFKATVFLLYKKRL